MRSLACAAYRRALNLRVEGAERGHQLESARVGYQGAKLSAPKNDETDV